LLVLVLLVWPRVIVAGEPPAIPEGALAAWTFNPIHPGALDAPPMWEGLARAAIGSGLIEDPDVSAVAMGVLTAASLGRAPHTAVLLDLAAEPAGEHGDRTRITALQAVVEVEVGEGHAELLRNLRAALIGLGDAADTGVQRELDLPGGVRGAAYTRPGWPAWREVSWASLPDRFLFGIGRGSLDVWLGEERVPDPHAALHIAQREGAMPTVLQVYADLDAFRGAFPEAFANGRSGAIAEAFSLANARDALMTARWSEPATTSTGAAYDGPPLVAIDISWSPRSREPGEVRIGQLSTPEWPDGELRMPPPPGTHAIVMRPNLTPWIALGQRVAVASQKSGRSRASVDIRTRRWNRDHGPAVAALERQLGPWLVLSDVPPPPASIPGLATVFVELAPGDHANAVDLVASLLEASGMRVSAPSAAGTIGVAVLPQSVDPGGVLRAATCGLAGPADRPVLVLGWSPNAVELARERLGDPGEPSD